MIFFWVRHKKLRRFSFLRPSYARIFFSRFFLVLFLRAVFLVYPFGLCPFFIFATSSSLWKGGFFFVALKRSSVFF